MKPCGHTNPVLPAPPHFTNGCRVCYLYETDEAYRALWDNQVPRVPQVPARRPLPCVYLGALVQHAQCACPRQDIRQCDKGHGQVSQVGACETCADYEADEPGEPGA